MKTVAFSSIKGGTGKSSLAILCANYCAAASARVLVIDLDIQNSASFYYLEDFDTIDKKNIALALHTGKIEENIVKSKRTNVDILPSHFALVNLRAISDRTLRKLLAAKPLPYDFVFIDCAPTYDNIVLNAVNCADLILTPVKFSQFDFKGCVFYRDQLGHDSDKLPAWRLFFNFYVASRSDSPDSTTHQYESIFRDTFAKTIVPVTVPKAALIQEAIDKGSLITQAKDKVKLFEAIKGLSEYIGVKGKVGSF